MEIPMPRILALITAAFLASSTFAESTVTVDKTHLCCPSCVKAATKAVESVSGDKADQRRKISELMDVVSRADR